METVSNSGYSPEDRATGFVEGPAAKRSCIALPRVEGEPPSIVDFLDKRFWRVGRDVWLQRLETGKVTGEDGCAIGIDAPYVAGTKLYYHREVEREPRVPFAEEIIYQDDNILVACKPHFLPVIPTGPYVNECLLYRLMKRTGNMNLVPVNRIDRETAGLVLFSTNPAARSPYYMLFQNRRVEKHYEAVCKLPPDADRNEWLVECRIVKSEPWFLVKSVEGPSNSRTVIKLRGRRENLGYFDLHPLTGQQHQLRLHMSLIGSQILNDPFYPTLQPEPKKTFENPLQLLARKLSFRDPMTGVDMIFESKRQLESWPSG